jgi:hypothetical protein
VSEGINTRIVNLMKQQAINRSYFVHTAPKVFKGSPYQGAHLKGFKGVIGRIDDHRIKTYSPNFKPFKYEPSKNLKVKTKH